MGVYKEIYEFAASAGAFEGYVYARGDIDADGIANWVENLVAKYRSMPPNLRDELQPSLDRTIGRAMLSLAPALGLDHVLLQKLRTMIRDELPRSPDDFEQEKREKKIWREEGSSKAGTSR